MFRRLTVGERGSGRRRRRSPFRVLPFFGSLGVGFDPTGPRFCGCADKKGVGNSGWYADFHKPGINAVLAGQGFARISLSKVRFLCQQGVV